MLSYRHIYHAGNFADVFKHVVLVQLLRALARKDTPFCVLDTHAGVGRYDLSADEAQKNREFANGVLRLLDCADRPEAVEDYLARVRSENAESETFTHYPGSPRLIRALLRPQDRLVLSELHKTDHAQLKQLFAGDAQVAVHLQDAYQGLKAFLPPKEKRGLVLIDPPYERKDEYERVAASLQMAHARWPTGVYAIWYPIMSRSLAQRFHTAIAATGIRKILRAELCIEDDTDRTRFTGSGLLIVNPPWPLQDEIAAVSPWLWNCLAPDKRGGAGVDWLVRE
ncbi:MAG: 23S rRNA (adenine(2030)-N(6))-methyltransferase RlmJ [Gammaproteobacteria bacterium]|nr:23S rRNA (adenine(2030)-N(6))-methyltransferase RlmJ [Gammaproteobacteria bacterium]